MPDMKNAYCDHCGRIHNPDVNCRGENNNHPDLFGGTPPAPEPPQLTAGIPVLRRIEWLIPGQPKQKVSPSRFKHPTTGKVIIKKDESNTPFEDKIRTFLKLSGQWRFPTATEPGEPAWPGPVRLTVQADFKMLTSWSQKKYREMLGGYHAGMPDLDRIENMIQDALKGLVFVDDSQVCRRGDSWKRYSDTPQTRIVIEFLEGPYW
jgi:Holliday junction resolvase RusA-like endonuclease